MPLRAHLAEFRKRLLWAVAGIAVGAVAGWFLYDPVFDLLQQPILDAAERSDGVVAINFSGIATALDLRLKVSFFIGFIVSVPWWLYQVWAFVGPALRRREKLYSLGFLGAAVPLFAAGVYLALWALPTAVIVLTGFVPAGSSNLNDANTYLTFAMRLMLGFGLGMVFPVLMVALTWLGVVRARTWLRGWRWAVVLIFIFSAVMTPTADALTMIVMAIPMLVLYFAAIGIGALRRRPREAQ